MRLFKNLNKDWLAILSLIIVAVTIIFGIFAPLLSPHDPEEVNMQLRYAASSWEYLLGNDHLGRCILSRLIYGIRPSVLWVLVALLVSIIIGATLGFISGYFRGKVDTFIMRICDVMLSFPGYVMTLAVVGVLGVGLENIIIAFILMKWAWFARVFRTSVMQYAELDYVKFSKAAGISDVKIIYKHIILVTFPDIAVISSSSIGSMILQLSGFSFLGLGIQAPNAEWGMMLNEARKVMFSRPELMLAPGLAIIIVVSAFNFLSDAIQVALDPKLTISKDKVQAIPAASKIKRQEEEVAK
ncbi:staphylopine uptake ABC transporter permease subunit CntC [Priestia megaterium]|jgi:nickel transport system permease protein|uniref:staphylopine uptake ABC transporter permease subunit CntC n=1 Tax=Priestia megaterium TaxID=1404 RepID=UPI0013E3856E|nr:nickel/cobalt ABC transporter permease [Priestia megaterium]MDI3091850.1 ABC transporter permease subunit [Priestia megaterium]MED3863913.1 ABC transporter permease subunit [Priestia megaterium]MED4101031.1 ABC transporter permease subunit [Priestia megaterium]MED4145416.1 ABC transporter permease subunit [Priestia megaterium]MED4170664.1 ABC transporter permease subunit [Priestia megaterium]